MPELKRKKSLSDTIDLKELSKGTEDNLWARLNRRINEKKVIPIIGNSVRSDRIFDINGDYQLGIVSEESAMSPVPELTIDEELAELWAKELHYPFPDKNRLTRVAVYNQVKSEALAEAKTKYLDFLKRCLLGLAKNDEEITVDLIEELKSRIITAGFADIANDLGYPKFKAKQADPLRLLARLPLPIYVTTSYYDFMERALQAEGRSPCSQICFWFDDINPLAREYASDPMFEPTVERPLVYHLFGLEKYPETIVLSEDDYMNFLLKIAQDTDPNHPVIPLFLRSALSSSSLLLLGYRLQDWDFRVLIRSVIKVSVLQWRNVAIQLDPNGQGGITDPQEAKAYLRQYFDKRGLFDVEWGNAESFINTLWQKWDEWRRSQA